MLLIGNCGNETGATTHRYTDLCRGHTEVVETIQGADEVWLPFIVVGELRAGFAVGTQGDPQFRRPSPTYLRVERDATENLRAG